MTQPVPDSYYIYAPTKGVSIVFAVLFAISGGLHIWQNNLKYHSWRIGLLLPWAALVFVAGFCLREYGAYHYDALNPFIASQVLLFIAPPIYNGADYFIFGRALHYLPQHSLIHPGRVWSTFIAFDTIDGIIAANGASYLANVNNSPSARRLGSTLIKASLILLLVLFLFFTSLIIHFHISCSRSGLLNRKIRIIIYTLYASSLLILLRNTFRTAASFFPYTPTNTNINTHEWPFFVLEVLPMLINSFMLNIYPPAKYLPRNHKVYLANDGKTELEGPGMVDKRNIFLTIVDPFDLGGLVRGRDSRNRFWERDGIGGPKEGGVGGFVGTGAGAVEEGGDGGGDVERVVAEGRSGKGKA